MPNDAVPFETRAPDFSCHPVAANIGSREILEFLATIYIAAGDRGSLAVREVEGRRQNRRRAPFAFRTNRLPSLHDRPTVIPASSNTVDHLPGFPANIANPQITCGPIKAHTPRIAQAVGPDFGPRPRRVHERIVGWHRVRL